MTQADIAKWLGRTLTPTETNNFNSYLNIAKSYLEGLLCASFDRGFEERLFETREGYSTVFTDYFTGDATVTINGVERTDYKTRFFDNRNTAFKNSLVFDTAFTCDTEVTIEAEWGFKCLPDDLGNVLAQLFAVAGKPYRATGDIKTKKVEDFSITFGDRSDVELIADAHGVILQKYSLCTVGKNVSSEVCRWT
jgi:hypothetical protein